MREKTSFRIAIVAIYIAIIAITAFLPTPEGLSFEGKMLIGILIGSIIMWITEGNTAFDIAPLLYAAFPDREKCNREERRGCPLQWTG